MVSQGEGQEDPFDSESHLFPCRPLEYRLGQSGMYLLTGRKGKLGHSFADTEIIKREHRLFIH